MNELGFIHIYCGDGKGKSTAAFGLALRAVGSGYKVLVCQFFKDGSSSEITQLKKIENITVKLVDKNFGFYKYMTDEKKLEVTKAFKDLQTEVFTLAEDYDVLILDEIISAFHYEVIDRERLLEFLKSKPKHLEVVMTGRNPDERLLELADYVTEMKKIKHPFDRNISGRQGIEF